MEPVKQSIDLVKDQHVRFECASNGYGCVSLYDGNAEEISASAPQSVAFRGMPPSSTDRLIVKFLSCYVESKNSHNVWLELDGSLLRNSSSKITSPKIRIQGTFGNWTFYYAGNDLATTKTVETFLGASYIVHTLNKSGRFSQFFDIKYSILLEFDFVQCKAEPERVNVLEKLFSDKLFADCIIVTAENTEIKCHRSVLAANSDIFHAMLTSGLEEAQTNVIRMVDVDENVVNELLSYLYGRDIKADEKNEDMAFKLLQVAHMYNISSLEGLMVKTILLKANETFNMNVALDLYFFTRNVEDFYLLCKKMLDIMRKRAKDFAASSSYQDLLGRDPTEAAKLAVKLLELGPL